MHPFLEFNYGFGFSNVMANFQQYLSLVVSDQYRIKTNIIVKATISRN